MLNPIIRNNKILIWYSAAWLLITIMQTVVFAYAVKLPIEFSLTDSLVFNILFYLMGLSFWYTTTYNSVEHTTTSKLLVNHIVAAVVSSIIWIVAGYFISKKILEDDALYLTFLDDSLVFRFIAGILLYAIIVSLYYVIIYYQNFQEKLLKEAELRTLVKEAELKSLKYQINPHFIFNSLNSISSLTMSDPSKAQEMTIKLSNFMRSTLARNEFQKNKLKDEINSAKLYLEIEHIRFSDRFDYTEEIDEKLLDVFVPGMILQPLFENAIKHGVYESISKVNIKLTCKRVKDFLKITLENDFDPEAVSKKGESIGITNIQNRLSLFYNYDNLLTTEKINNVFTAKILIPLNG